MLARRSARQRLELEPARNAAVARRRERARPTADPRGRTVDVPTAYAAFPREILRPPRSLASRTYTNIQRWTVMEKGGHFAALEQPKAVARDVTDFFRGLRV